MPSALESKSDPIRVPNTLNAMDATPEPTVLFRRLRAIQARMSPEGDRTAEKILDASDTSHVVGEMIICDLLMRAEMSPAAAARLAVWYPHAQHFHPGSDDPPESEAERLYSQFRSDYDPLGRLRGVAEFYRNEEYEGKPASYAARLDDFLAFTADPRVLMAEPEVFVDFRAQRDHERRSS